MSLNKNMTKCSIYVLTQHSFINETTFEENIASSRNEAYLGFWSFQRRLKAKTHKNVRVSRRRSIIMDAAQVSSVKWKSAGQCWTEGR